MNMKWVLVIWLLVAGVILGVAINDKAKECGGPVNVKNGALIGALAWPLLLVTAFVVDKSNLKKDSCEEGVYDHNTSTKHH